VRRCQRDCDGNNESVVTVSSSTKRPSEQLKTPDGRYLVVRGQLWRCTDPNLSNERRTDLTKALMTARRAKLAAMRKGDDDARVAAKQSVDDAKRALGERGPVWWDDSAPDLTRKMARTTIYADRYAKHSEA
jgi:hypothetical protein